MSKTIFVSSVPRDYSAFNINAITNPTSGKRLQKSKVGNASTYIRPMYSAKHGALNNYISFNPWLDDKGQPMKGPDGTPLSLQDKYEKQFDLPKGYLSPKTWHPSDPKDAELTYFQRSKWKLNDGSTPFNLDTLDGLMGYYVCLASKLVANSEKEWRSHRWPHAQFYISIENESDEIKYKANEIKSLAFAALHSPDLTLDLKRKVLSLLEVTTIRSSLTDLQVNNLLYEYIDRSDNSPSSNITKFNWLLNLLSTSPGREEFEARYLIKSGTDLRIISDKQSTYTYIRPKGVIVLGDSLQEAISFILNPKKDTFVDELKQDIKNKL